MSLFYICKSGRVPSESVSCSSSRVPRGPRLHKPNESQLLRLRNILPVVLGLRYRSLAEKGKTLAPYGFEVVERRVPCLCEIGSYFWYPRLRLFRVVVCPPHIHKHRPCFPYAKVIEVRLSAPAI